MTKIKTILITGSTDGLGLATALMLAEEGHRVLIHGRSEQKLTHAAALIEKQTGTPVAGSYRADLSDLRAVSALADDITAQHPQLDALINNAGVFILPASAARGTMDMRILVNMVAPYLLTKKLLPLLGAQGRVVNLSSAAQSHLSPAVLTQSSPIPDGLAYAQSKLGVTMWTNALAAQAAGRDDMPLFVSVNPKSFLATPMVRAAYGVSGSDVRVGADILCRAALSEEFARANGKYYDNDIARFTSPHRSALDLKQCQDLVHAMDRVIAPYC